MFIKMLERTRSVTAAARAVGLSRAGAHRFRRRAAGSLFASLWDHAVGRKRLFLASPPASREVDQGHSSARRNRAPAPP